MLFNLQIFSSIYLHNIEVEILREINLNRVRELDVLFQFVTNSVSYFTWGIPLLLLFIGILNKKKLIQNKSLFLLLSVITSSLISLILKYSIDRQRPFDTYNFFEKISSGGSPSFPSGHTTEAFAFAVALCFVYPRWYIIVPSILWAIIIGYTRMSFGVHYPSDVLAGAILGILSVVICLSCLKCFSKVDIFRNKS